MMVRTTTSSVSNSTEKENLAVHVELESHRYTILENRISAVEKEVDEIKSSAAASRAFIIKAISIATTVISFTLSLTIVILDKLK